MDLTETLRVDTRQDRNSTSDELSVVLEEFYGLVVVFLRSEDVGVGKHVKSHEQVDEQRPLDDVARLMRQVRTESWRDAVELEEQGLVSPVDDEAEHKTGEVEDWDGRREHHNDPDHGNQLGEAIVKLDLSTRVDGFVLTLDDLLGLRAVRGAASIHASLAAGNAHL